MGPVERGASIDDLLDRAVAAINGSDRVTSTALAGRVLAVDEGNAEAEDLLAAPGDAGEIRRLTILFADPGLFDTALHADVELVSTRVRRRPKPDNRHADTGQSVRRIRRSNRQGG